MSVSRCLREKKKLSTAADDGDGGKFSPHPSHEDNDLQNHPSCDPGQYLVKNCLGCLCQTGYSVAVHVRSAIGCAHAN